MFEKLNIQICIDLRKIKPPREVGLAVSVNTVDQAFNQMLENKAIMGALEKLADK